MGRTFADVVEAIERIVVEAIPQWLYVERLDVTAIFHEAGQSYGKSVWLRLGLVRGGDMLERDCRYPGYRNSIPASIRLSNRSTCS